MSNSGKTRTRWTTFVIASLLICVMLSFGAMAQTRSTKPLDPEATNALVEQLKSKLEGAIEDEDLVAAIVEKWEARELTGKTREQILKLLFEDVKSTVKDEALTKGIWDSWNETEGDTETTETPTQSQSQPTVAPSPPPAQSPNFWVKLVHDGWYVAHFQLTWDEPGKPNNVWRRDPPKGWHETIEIPHQATNIRLIISNDTGLVWQPQREIINKALQPADLNRCYKVVGTTLGSAWNNECQ